MKVIVACDHCSEKLRANLDRVPDEGVAVPCPSCHKKFHLMKPDAYYLEKYSREVAVYILYRKKAGQTANLKRDLALIQILGNWLETRDLDFSMAEFLEIQAFFREIEKRLENGKVVELRHCLTAFFDILMREGEITASPLLHRYFENSLDLGVEVDPAWIGMEQTSQNWPGMTNAKADWSHSLRGFKAELVGHRLWVAGASLLVVVTLLAVAGWHWVNLHNDLERARAALGMQKKWVVIQEDELVQRKKNEQQLLEQQQRLIQDRDRAVEAKNDLRMRFRIEKEILNKKIRRYQGSRNQSSQKVRQAQGTLAGT